MNKIYISDMIDPFWGVSLVSIVDQLKTVPEGQDIEVVINSPGGSVTEGLAIYHAIRSFKGKKTVTVSGIAASMASVIMLAGDEIRMTKGSLVMVHNPLTIAYGNAKELEKEIEVLRKIEDSIAGIYALRTGMDIEEARSLMNAETYMTAEQAVELKFAHSIIDGETIVGKLDMKFAACLGAMPEQAKKFFAIEGEKKAEETETESTETKSEETTEETESQSESTETNTEEATETQSAESEEPKPDPVAQERARIMAIQSMKFDGLDESVITGLVNSGASVEESQAKIFPLMQKHLALNSLKKSGKVIEAENFNGELPGHEIHEKWQSLKGVDKTKFYQANKVVINAFLKELKGKNQQ